MSQNRSLRQGFTLIELLVVIAIIAVLIALLLPAVQSAREAARRAQCVNNMKQLGLAIMNFESVNKTYPPDVYGFLPALNDQDPNALAGGNNNTRDGWMEMILPYMEQNNIYNLCNLSVSVFNTQNLPPSTGKYSGNCSAYSIPINGFICPSSPQPSSINYWAGMWEGSGNGPEGYTPSPPTQIWGLTDYLAVPGFHCELIAGLGIDPLAGSSGYTCGYCNNEPGLISSPGTKQGNSIASCTDGTSNTIMIGESCGRPIGYNRAKQVFPDLNNGGRLVDGVIWPAQGGGGAWADPFSYAHLAGSSPNGMRGIAWGTCMINCTSDNELFSFHPGGVNMLFGDGSVHFLKDSLNPKVLVYLVCRADGGIISSDQY